MFYHLLFLSVAPGFCTRPCTGRNEAGANKIKQGLPPVQTQHAVLRAAVCGRSVFGRVLFEKDIVATMSHFATHHVYRLFTAQMKQRHIFGKTSMYTNDTSKYRCNQGCASLKKQATCFYAAVAVLMTTKRRGRTKKYYVIRTHPQHVGRDGEDWE